MTDWRSESSSEKQVTLTPISGDDAPAVMRLRGSAGQDTVPPDGGDRYVFRYASRSLATATMEDGAWMRTIREGDEIVGLALVDHGTDPGTHRLRALLIDAGHQGRGLGTRAMEKIVAHVKSEGAGALELRCLPAPRGAEDFFRGAGFIATGRMTGEEMVMRLDLSGREPDFTVTLRPVTAGIATYICSLEGSEHVAPNAVTLVEGSYSDRAWLRAIYLGEEPVGLVMLHDDPEGGNYFLWRLMVSPRHRGRGCGREAVRQVIAYVRDVRRAGTLKTSCGVGPGTPERFYLEMGFVPTGEMWDDEKVLELDLDGSRT